jgi:hypothetical protein
VGVERLGSTLTERDHPHPHTLPHKGEGRSLCLNRSGLDPGSSLRYARDDTAFPRIIPSWMAQFATFFS